MYTAPANSVNPAIPDTEINATDFNAMLDDLSEALTESIASDGVTTVTANIPMAGFKLTGVGLATTLGDALSYGRNATVAALVATTVNGNTFTTGTGTLTLGAGKTATISNTLTFTGTDASSVAFGTGGTVLYSGGTNNIGVATGTSLALNGATIGSNALAVAGTSLFTDDLTVSKATNGLVSSQVSNSDAGVSARASLAVGNGATSAILRFNGTGFTTSGVQRQSGGSLLSSGTGGLTIGTSAAGALYIAINNTQVAQFDAVLFTLGVAMNYGGVALSNSVTGTGSMVLSESPTLTGTLAGAAATFSSTVTGLSFSPTGGSFAAGKMYLSAGDGLVIGAKTGSAYDFSVVNNAGTAYLLKNPTGTNDVAMDGALVLGNAYVATPQVTTGYVTLKDSSGTTYKVLVAA